MFQSSKTFMNVCRWAIQKPLINDTAKEKVWGNMIIGYENATSQWTTKLGEYFVEELLYKLGYNVRQCKKIGHYNPDRETDEYIVEVKTRNWTTTGTAGEKVYGTPLKYAGIPKATGKPLLIVCVAFQEYEFTYGNTPVFGSTVHEDQQEFLDFYRSKNIYYIPCSYLIYLYLTQQKISLDNICPMNNILPPLSLIPDSLNLSLVVPSPPDTETHHENTL
jgi:hypothetical protein